MVWKSNIQTILEIWTWKLLSCVQLFATPRTTQSNPVDYTVHGMLQARILEWVAVSFSWGSSQPRGQTHVSHTVGEFFTIWAIRHRRGGLSGNSKQLSIYLMSLYLIQCSKKHLSMVFSFLNDQITLLTLHIVRLLTQILFIKFLSIPYYNKEMKEWERKEKEIRERS